MKELVLAAAMIGGCMGSGDGGNDTESVSVSPCSNATYLCVGMEKSVRFGSCPGCEKDARAMDKLMSEKFGYSGSLLISSDATKEEVVSKLRNGIENTPEDGMFLFFYSGHGGQEYLGFTEPNGADKSDEYLCLYDTYMLDDEIWYIVSGCKGRVFLYFDACHSATMYRSVASELKVSKRGEGKASAMSAGDLVRSSGFTFRPYALQEARAMSFRSKSLPMILCWSGCKESEYSYGGSGGGVMTTALSRNWKQGICYDDLWKKVVEAVKKEQPTQNPTQTYIGSGFKGSMEAFR